MHNVPDHCLIRNMFTRHDTSPKQAGKTKMTLMKITQSPLWQMETTWALLPDQTILEADASFAWHTRQRGCPADVSCATSSNKLPTYAGSVSSIILLRGSYMFDAGLPMDASQSFKPFGSNELTAGSHSPGKFLT